tara:strand:+ start:1165 stop:1347 length:183 start_codon:yes stop_codon:yes gene_type:complete
MKATIKLVQKQHNVLVDVIQYLDSTKQSNTKIREAVDEILNHSEKLHEDSEMELTRISLK